MTQSSRPRKKSSSPERNLVDSKRFKLTKVSKMPVSQLGICKIWLRFWSSIFYNHFSTKKPLNFLNFQALILISSSWQTFLRASCCWRRSPRWSSRWAIASSSWAHSSKKWSGQEQKSRQRKNVPMRERKRSKSKILSTMETMQIRMWSISNAE